MEKFKRHIVTSKEVNTEKYRKNKKLTESINCYYDQQLKYIQPYETQNKLKNLHLYFKDRIIAHIVGESNNKKSKFLFKIIDLNNNNFQCFKLYDNNNIKINLTYYYDLKYYYSINCNKVSSEPINENSELYHLLSKEVSDKILKDYANDKINVLKAYFKTLKNLNNYTTGQQRNILGITRNISHNYGSILVTPYKIEPNRLNLNDYEFQYSLNKITKVRNKKEGSYIEYIAIDEEAEKAKKPIRYKIYYNIKNNKINLIHCHVLDKDLKSSKIIIKEIDKNIDPKTLKKKEEYIKNNELLLIARDLVPIKLYYKGKKVKMESIKIEENKLYLLSSTSPESIFNRMYVTINKIGDKLENNLTEKCNELTYDFNALLNGVDAQVTYDNNKNYVVEPMMFAVTPCLLQKLSTFEENNLKKNKVKEVNEVKGVKDKVLSEMEKYFLITEKMNDFKKYNKEAIDKMDQKDRDNILLILNDYKDSMAIILNYIQANGIWETLDNAVNLNMEIEKLIKLFKNK